MQYPFLKYRLRICFTRGSKTVLKIPVYISFLKMTKGPFIWSRVPETTLPLSYPDRATTTLKSRCNTAPLPPGSMLVEQTGPRVVIASISFLNNIAWEGEGGRCLARQVFQHFECNCSFSLISLKNSTNCLHGNANSSRLI